MSHKNALSKTYTIERLIRAYSENSLPEQFLICGRFKRLNLEPVLWSPTRVVKLPSDGLPQLAIENSLISVLVNKNDVFITNDTVSVKTICQFNSFKNGDNSEAQKSDFIVAEQFFAKLAAKSQYLLAWQQFLFLTRKFFSEQGFLEIHTPSLVLNPGMEPELEPFMTELKIGSRRIKKFLPTSPELHLKQMLAAGYSDIFEIKNVFRNEEVTEVHSPEFHMVEWYRAFSHVEQIFLDLKSYLIFLCDHWVVDPNLLGQTRPMLAAETHPVHADPQNAVLNRALCEYKNAILNMRKVPVRWFFKEHLGFTLTPHTTKEELYILAEKLALEPSHNMTWNDLFHLIWVARIEPNLTDQPLVIHQYPPSQAALATIDNEGWAERFEFYWRKLEICNAFNELTDEKIQRQRFENDQKMRGLYGRTPLEIDEKFMSALKFGLPPSGGVALGLERLFMAFLDVKNIAEVRAFNSYY